jgi:hypothetical protein
MEYFHKRGVNHRHQAGKPGRGLEGRLALSSQLERGTPTSQPDQEIHVLLILCLFTLPEFLSSRLNHLRFPTFPLGYRISVVIHQDLPCSTHSK